MLLARPAPVTDALHAARPSSEPARGFASAHAVHATPRAFPQLFAQSGLFAAASGFAKPRGRRDRQVVALFIARKGVNLDIAHIAFNGSTEQRRRIAVLANELRRR